MALFVLGFSQTVKVLQGATGGNHAQSVTITRKMESVTLLIKLYIQFLKSQYLHIPTLELKAMFLCWEDFSLRF